VHNFSKPEGPLVSRYAENAIYCKLSPGPGSRGRSRASTPLPWPWPRPHPTRTEVAAVHCVLTVKKGGSLRSATTPTKGDRLLISLPVEQQLLELKPNGSKIGNTRVPTSSGRRESSTWLVHPPEVPLQVRCASESRRQAGRGLASAISHRWPTRPHIVLGLGLSGLRALVWYAPYVLLCPPSLTTPHSPKALAGYRSSQKAR
jgi:hypothetical protein